MQVLVESRDIIIKVKDVSDMCVCTRCKGAKALWRYKYYDSAALSRGGLLSIADQIACPTCHGEGFWKVPQ